MSLSPIRKEGAHSYSSILFDPFSSTLKKVLKTSAAVLGVMAAVQIPTPINAQEIVGSAEFRINNYTLNGQESPDVATLPFLGEERFVAVWKSRGQVSELNTNIYGQHFNGKHKLDGEFRVDEGSNQQQTSPSVAHSGNGSIVTTWIAEEIYIRGFDSQTIPMSPAFIANTHRSNSQNSVVLATSWKGVTALAWESWGSPGMDRSEIAAQFFYPNTSFMGEEIIVNQNIEGQQYRPSIAVFTDASFVISWPSSITQYAGYFGRRFDSDGVQMSGDFPIFNSSEFFETISLCSLDNNDFVAVGNIDRGVFAQIQSQNGVVRVPTFQIYNFTFDSQNQGLSFSPIPKCTGLPDRGFSVIWSTYWTDTSPLEAGSKGIYQQPYSYMGIPIGPLVRVDQNTTIEQSNPQIEAFPSGKVVAAWEGRSSNDTFGWDVYGRVFDPILSISSSDSSQPPSDSVYSPSPSLNSKQPTSASSSYASTSDSVYSPSSSPTSERPASPSSSYASTAANSVYSPSSPLNSERPASASTRAETFSSSFSAETESISSSKGAIPSVVDIQYEKQYPIVINGQTVGTFSFLGGEGTLDPNTSNTLHIDLDPNYTLEDGVIVTLFTIPQGEENLWQDLVLEFENDSQCVSVEGESVFDESRQQHDYELVFEFTSSECGVGVQASALHAFSVLISGISA